ncbi:MAG: OmpA family protein [Bacteroidia bacterium]|nr:OmpA family protein [Bacteroidia bacterium]MDW8347790.1 OmpA family protein [Bacteroidia bacterium]
MKKLIWIFILCVFLCSIIVAQSYVVSTVAGNGTPGYRDEVGVKSIINGPNGICFDRLGNVFFADENNHVIRKIHADGTVSTYAGVPKQAGKLDGRKTTALFNAPHGLCFDKLGNLYVADYNNHVIRKITILGTVSTVAGSLPAGFEDGQGEKAKFHYPIGLAVDSKNNVYILDSHNNAIRKMTPDGTVTTFAGNGTPGFANGKGKNALFDGPIGICIDMYDNLYIVDANNKAIRKITPDGTVSTYLHTDFRGFTDSTIYYNRKRLNFASSLMNTGGGVAVSPDAKKLYIADGGSNVIFKVDMEKKYVTVIAGSGKIGWRDGDAKTAMFNSPVEIIADAQESIYICDYRNNCIRKIKPKPAPQPKNQNQEVVIVKPKSEPQPNPIKPQINTNKTYILQGTVKDKNTGNVIPNIPIQIDENKTQPILSDNNGRYTKEITFGKHVLKVQTQGYLPLQADIIIPEKQYENVYDIFLEKIEVGKKMVLKNIHFEPNSTKLADSSYKYLQDFADYLKKNPNVKVRINGHTDIGSKNEQDNINLSENRAKVVMLYLITQGVDKKQLSSKGFGSSQPIADNATSEGRAKNRRTEFEIIER